MLSTFIFIANKLLVCGSFIVNWLLLTFNCLLQIVEIYGPLSKDNIIVLSSEVAHIIMRNSIYCYNLYYVGEMHHYLVLSYL